MYCKQCGAQISGIAPVCVNCGLRNVRTQFTELVDYTLHAGEITRKEADDFYHFLTGKLNSVRNTPDLMNSTRDIIMSWKKMTESKK